MAKAPRKRMSKQEQEKWDALYSFVRTKVLGYDENQALSTNMVLRLKGMLSGKFMENNALQDKANYSYDVVLNTFKYCMPDIQRALNTVSFENENHKFNYIMRIVDGNLNTVYMRMKQREKVEEESKKSDLSYAADYVNMFKAKKTNNNSKLDDLW